MSISNFSISQNPTVTFLKKLNSELDALVLQRNAGIELEQDHRRKQELRIQLMYDIERLRIEKMKENFNIPLNFSQKYDSSAVNSGKTLVSNFSNTVLAQRKKKLVRLNSKDTRNMKKKSLFIGRPDLGFRVDIRKRNSHQIDLGANNLSEFSYNKDILQDHDDTGIADKIFESIKNNSFKLEKLREEKMEDFDSSDISDEPFSPKERYNQGFFEDDGCSVDSKDLEPEYEIEEEDMETSNDVLKEVALISVIKERNVLYGYSNSNSNVNLLAYFKSGLDNNFSHNQRKLPFEETDYNYTYLVAENKLILDRIYHASAGDALLYNPDTSSKISEFEPSTKSRVQIAEFEDKSTSDDLSQFTDITYTIKIDNNPVSYSTHLDNTNSKHMTTYCVLSNPSPPRSFPNKLDLLFDTEVKSHFKARVPEGCYSSFMNLDQLKFRDRLILEEGSFFMVSEKRGFYVSLIATEKERNKKRDFFKKHVSPEKIEFCATNFDFTKAHAFYCYMAGIVPTTKDTSLRETEMEQFKAKYQSFCLEYVKNNDVSVICLNIVEYLFDYRIYKTVKKCVLFQVSTNPGDFFLQPSDHNFSIKFGYNLHKAMKPHKLQNLHSVAAFNFPYDVTVGYKYELGKFYLHYSNFVDVPSEYFYFQDERTDRYLAYHNSDKADESQFKEGLWLSLAKFVEFSDSFCTGDYYTVLPYGCLLMFHKNVFRVTKKSMQIVNK